MDTKNSDCSGVSQSGPLGQTLRQTVALVAVLSLTLTPMAWADRTTLKPGWNMFSTQQDIEVGQQVSKDAERQLPMLKNSRVDNYVNNLGRKLAAKAPGEKYPYQFKVVNDRAINAFALPGGYVYINRGVIEAANTESQLAGVIAHEISHVALRHGTNQASKASAAQVPLAILGGLLGSNSTGAMLAQLGAGFALNSVLLKYSRGAESQADLMGTQILYDSNFDTRGMAQFFEVIQAENQGGRQVEFFSNHPNPDNRVASVNKEVSLLGGSQQGFKSDSSEFQSIKRYVRSLPAPPGKSTTQNLQGEPGRDDTGQGTSQPARPSNRLKYFQNSVLRIDYPDSWQTYGQGDAVTITPRGGLVDDGHGNQALAYGVIINVFEPHSDGDQYNQRLQGSGFGQQGSDTALEQATDRLVEALGQTNKNMRVVRDHEAIRVDRDAAFSTYLSNDSPAAGGGRETNWLITLQRPEGLLFIVFVAPEREFQSYESTFQQMLRSVRISQ
jgi:Zn-dependent protease with chaperone function